MTALWNHSFVRFLLVGIVNTIVGLSIIYVLLNGAGIGYWPATLIGNGIGAAVSYMLNRSFTFGSRTQVRRSLWKFFCGCCSVLLFSLMRSDLVFPIWCLPSPAAMARIGRIMQLYCSVQAYIRSATT